MARKINQTYSENELLAIKQQLSEQEVDLVKELPAVGQDATKRGFDEAIALRDLELPEVFSFLRIAAERNAERFARIQNA